MDATREPLATYEQAVWRLAQYEVGQANTLGQMDLAIQIVADVFWFSQAKVRNDMEKAARSVASKVHAPRRARAVISRELRVL
jgi:hypothetical protein